MKKHIQSQHKFLHYQKIIFLWALHLCIFTAFAHANYSGEIIDRFGDNMITIQFDDTPAINNGDKIDLTYMAGFLPMAMGIYEVTTVKNNVVIAKPRSINIPAEKGMTVTVDILDATQPISKIMKDEDKTQKLVLLDPTPEELSSKNIEIPGEVIEVTANDEIKVAVKGNGNPKPGWFVDLFYITSQGKELPVGTWTINSVNGQTLSASKTKGIGNAREGLKAVIYNTKSSDNSSKNTYSPNTGVGSVKDHISPTGAFKDPSAQQPLNMAANNDPLVTSPAATLMGIDPARWEKFTYEQYVAELKQKYPPENSAEALKLALSESAQTGRTLNWWLGVRIEDNKDIMGSNETIPHGVRIITVLAGSAAEKAGLQAGDIVYAINKTNLSDFKQFLQITGTSKTGKLTFAIERNYQKLTIPVKLQKVK